MYAIILKHENRTHPEMRELHQLSGNTVNDYCLSVIPLVIEYSRVTLIPKGPGWINESSRLADLLVNHKLASQFKSSQVTSQ